MNVDQIYQLQRDDAFARQFSAEKYHTFVAMPFSNRGGYPEPRIKKLLLEDVHVRANELLGDPSGKRSFDSLSRVDGGSAAVVITDQIISEILNCHFFIGDLTGCNFGVVLETGIALALKPNHRVLLFTQDDTASLHFDLKVTNINRYKEEDLVETAAKGLVEAAVNFEKEANRYIRLLSSQLTPDAIVAMRIYLELWGRRQDQKEQPSLWEETAAIHGKRFRDDAGRLAFHHTVRELLERRLFWTDYVTEALSGFDRYGIHATNLGWKVIEHIWMNKEGEKQPVNAPTGPNFS